LRAITNYHQFQIITLRLVLQLLQILTVFFLPKYFFVDTIWHHEWSVTILFLSFKARHASSSALPAHFLTMKVSLFSIVPLQDSNEVSRE